MEDIRKTALEIMEKVCENDEIGEDLDLDLSEAGLIDSFAAIEILLEIESRFGIRLQPTDIAKKDITTVNNFIFYLEKMVNK